MARNDLTSVEKPVHGQQKVKDETSKIAPAPRKQTPATPSGGGTIDSSRSTETGQGVAPSVAPGPPPSQSMETTFFANAFFEMAQNNPRLVEQNPQLQAIIQTYLNMMKGKQ